jgi:putative ABC transport system ATP-binding protein
MHFPNGPFGVIFGRVDQVKLPQPGGQKMLPTILLKASADISNSTSLAEAGQHTTAPHRHNALTLEARNLSRVTGNKSLVSNISIQVQPGEVVAVIGPSGAGKSSFLRLLNRLDEPTSGTVLLNGENYRDIAPPDLRRRVGMVMQTAYLFPGTVAANIAFGPRQHSARIASGQIAALLDRVGLPGYEDRDVNTLSGGEAQRVSVARTLANSPEALLLDEPTSSLDEAAARGVEELVLGIIEERGLTCVIVTHNRSQATRMAGRTMVLEAGRLIAVGPTPEMLDAH